MNAMPPPYIERTKEKFPLLSKGLKKVADQLLADPIPFAIHPAKKVGSIIGVSETMVIRFCYEIGYPGFSDLQKELRQNLLNLNQDIGKSEEHLPSLHRVAARMAEDIPRIKTNVEELDPAAMEQAIETIIDSERVIVAGYYHSFSFAHWLSFNLNYILGNACLYRPETDPFLPMASDQKTSIVLFSFFRYAAEITRLAEEAKQKGIRIIVITDSRVSPAAELADIVIPLNVAHQKAFLSKGPVTLSFINAMLTEISERVETRGLIQPSNKFFIKDVEV